ncbi:MAG: phenylacetate--CoA ligase family protein [Rhodoferax sp.]
MSLLHFLPGAAAPLLRRLLLGYARRIDVGRMLASSRRGAIQAAVQAARHSAAYRALLQEHHIEPSTLGTQTDLSALPVLTKANTFERFTLEQLARPTPTTELADVLTSSGRSGRSFGFRLTTRAQHETSWFDIDLGLQDMFNIDQYATLLVNCLPMGVVFRSRAVAVANVSVREDMACSILRDVGPRFGQTLLCSDPLFIRRVLDEARIAGVDWPALNTSVIMGEEVLVEAQRDYIAARMGIDLDRDPHRMIGSSFGVGELGLNLLFETRETIRLRRAMRAQAEVAQLLSGTSGGSSMPSVFCFSPMRCHIEVLHPDLDGFGELCFTMLDRHAIIALPRYASGDMGKLVSREHVARAAQLAATDAPWLPVVAVKGRIKDRPAGMPSVESIKELIYLDHALADQLTGAFRIDKDEAGSIRLTLQTNSERAAQDARLRQQLVTLGRSRFSVPVEIHLLAPFEFPHRPVLDYERKFSYIAPVH